jgi:Fe-Mn family superoxide dismutase
MHRFSVELKKDAVVLAMTCTTYTKRGETGMAYTAKDYSHILGMEGISDETLKNHFTLYQGYVSNTNTLLEETARLVEAQQHKSPEFAEMRRRFGFEFDGMRLHEYYFDNLKGNGQLDPQSDLYKKIVEDFGSYDHWKNDFLGTLAMRGIGWAVLLYDHKWDRLLNAWIELHQTNVLAGLPPLLVVDAWEHAYYLDYQTGRPGYIEAIFANLDWDEVIRRFENNPEIRDRRKAA